jgi:PPOX class probable F420-dependent enzyme
MSGRASRLLRHAVDAQYRLYDRMRHRDAARAASTPGHVGPFEEIGDSGYLLLVTFKRNGEPVPTPVMFSKRDGKLWLRGEPTAKIKRLRAEPRVRVAGCDARGKPKTPVYEGRARELPREEHERAWRVLREGYSRAIRVYESVADRAPFELTYVVVSPVESSESDRSEASGAETGEDVVLGRSQ